MNSSERFTLSQTAKILKVSTPTARRLVFSGKLRGIKVMVGDRMRWEIPRDEVFRLRNEGFPVKEEHFTSEPNFELGSHLPCVQSGTPTKHSDAPSKASPEAFEGNLKPASDVPLAAHLAALELASKQIDRLNDQAEKLQARVEQAERIRIALEYQMKQYQVALSDQAESLAEERAKRISLEARQEILPSIEALKIDSPKPDASWSRLKRWLGLKTG